MKINFPFTIVALLAAMLACCKLPTTPTQLAATLPAPTSTQASQPAPTETSTASPTDAPTETPTQALTETPTETSVLPPLPTGSPPAGLDILSFTVDVEDLPPMGKRLVFHWQTTGAVDAIIWSGTSRRFPQAWDVPTNGTHTVELKGTLYRNPSMTLMAYDTADNQVSESVTIEWACEYDYFFTPAPAACPRYKPSETWASEQPFEHGRMIWLEEIHGADYVLRRFILVLYDDGAYDYYEDAWTEEMPESDPTITSPPGLMQPTRGFGKIWRENPSVQDKLGWATASEQGFTTIWQEQIGESIGQSKAFVRLLGGQVVQINAWDVRADYWEFLAP